MIIQEMFNAEQPRLEVLELALIIVDSPMGLPLLILHPVQEHIL
jgi:hypothetical protein